MGPTRCQLRYCRLLSQDIFHIVLWPLSLQLLIASDHDTSQMAVWSSGMIVAQGATGLGFNSRNGPIVISNADLMAEVNKFRRRELNPGLPRDRRKY